MSHALYMDVHVRRAVTNGLRLRGINVLTAQEDQATTMSDRELLERALVLNRVVFTQDDDFLAEAASRSQRGEPFATVIYAHQLKATVRECIESLELFCKAGESEDALNRIVFIPF